MMPSPSSQRIKRCAWCEDTSLAYIEYHDKEWGVPVKDDLGQFEFLVLEGAQAGLSWSTILNKREGYRKNFADFDPEKVAPVLDVEFLRLGEPDSFRGRILAGAIHQPEQSLFCRARIDAVQTLVICPFDSGRRRSRSLGCVMLGCIDLESRRDDWRRYGGVDLCQRLSVGRARKQRKSEH